LSPVGQTYNLTVSNQGALDYVFTGSDGTTNHANALDPVISCSVGDTLNFTLNIIGNHPFWIKTVGATGTGFGVAGVINNGVNSGTVTWTPTTSGTYWYICQFHNGMRNTIQVS
jgi:plastocyanin